MIKRSQAYILMTHAAVAAPQVRLRDRRYDDIGLAEYAASHVRRHAIESGGLL